MSVKHGGSGSMRSSKSEANSINSPETIAATILGATGGIPGPTTKGGKFAAGNADAPEENTYPGTSDPGRTLPGPATG